MCVAVALLLACFDCDAPSPAATASSVPCPSLPSASHTPHGVDDVRSVETGGGGDGAEEAGNVEDSVKELHGGGGFGSARFVGRVWLDGGRVVLPEGRQVRGNWGQGDRLRVRFVILGIGPLCSPSCATCRSARRLDNLMYMQRLQP